eukprot:5195426-Prymnesium_polylepis.1
MAARRAWPPRGMPAVAAGRRLIETDLGPAGGEPPAQWPSGVDLRCVRGEQSDWTDRTVIVPATFKEWQPLGH